MEIRQQVAGYGNLLRAELMGVPYTPAFAARVLVRISDKSLAAITPQHFRRWPAASILPEDQGRDLIKAERARRAALR